MWNPYTSAAPPQLMVLTIHKKEQHVMPWIIFKKKWPALLLLGAKNIYKVEKLPTLHLAINFRITRGL